MSIVPFASQRQLGLENATWDKGVIYGPVKASSQGAALAYKLQKNPKKKKKINLGGPCRLGGCWRCFLVKVKVNINFAVQKVGGKAPDFTACVNNLLCLESIQLSLFASLGLVCLIFSKQNFTLWSIYSCEFWCCFMQIKQKDKTRSFVVTFPSAHSPFQSFFCLFLAFLMT